MPDPQHELDAALRGYIDADIDGRVILDIAGRTVFVNQRHLELWGVSREDHSLPAAERSATIRSRVSDPQALAGTAEARVDPINTFTWIIPFVDGRTVEVRSQPIFDKSGKHLGRSYTSRDVTAQVLVEAELRESEARVRNLVASMKVGVVFIDGDARVTAANESAQAILGAPEAQLLGRTPNELGWSLVQEDGSRLPDSQRPSSVLETGKPIHNLMAGLHTQRNGLRWLLMNADPLTRGNLRGAVCTFQDVTDRRETRSAVARAERDDAVAALAAGVAHKLNNALTAIIGNAFLLDTLATLDAEAKESLSDILKVSRDAATVVNDLLAVSGSTLEAVSSVDVAQLARAAVSALSLADRARVSLQIDENIPTVRFAASSMERAFIHLLTNALEVGHSVRAAAFLEDRQVQYFHRPSAPGQIPLGKYAVLEVTDDGPGLDPAIERDIFRPFVSSKGTGKGLGLSAAAGMMGGNGGFIELSPGHVGLSARLMIPLSG